MEKQIHVIIRNQNGGLSATTFRNPQPTDACSLVVVGGVIGWRGCDMYHTKYEGEVIAIKKNDWDYSRPIGQREINPVIFGDFQNAIKKYRAQ